MADTVKIIIGLLVVVGILALTVGSCENTHHTASGEIDAVYWHEGSRYTVMTNNADIITKRKLPPWGVSTKNAVSLHTDVATGAKSWYTCTWERNNWVGADGDVSHCEIHIHSLDELGTADWNHGKFGSGATTRLD